MTVAPQAETEVVTGQIQGIVQKGPDKWQVEVNVGQQNPRRLWTKDSNLVAQLSMMIGQHQSFLCGISHWTNQQNQPVRSLWINGVGQPGGFQGQQAPPQQPMQQQPIMQQFPQPVAMQAPMPPPQQPTVVQPTVTQMGPVAQMGPTQTEKEDRIHRQTATKVASILISHVPAEQRTLDNVLVLAERLVAYYEHGLAATQAGAEPQYDGDPGPQGAPPDDGQFPSGY